MGILKNNPLFSINKKAIKVPPLWRFFLREYLNELRQDLRGLLKKQVQVEFIARSDIDFDSLDYLASDKYLGVILEDQRNIPLFIYIETKEANALINLLHGNVDVINFERELTHLNKLVLDNFLESCTRTLNKTMQDRAHNLSYSHSKRMYNNKFYGTELIFQIDYIKLNIFIPEDFYRFQAL